MTRQLEFLSDPDDRARVRRLSRRAMDVLEYERTWTGPMGQVATQAAVVRSVEIMIKQGEHDEAEILERVLQIVCGGRLTTALRATLASTNESPTSDAGL